MFRTYKVKQLNLMLVLGVVVLSIIGIAVIGSASSSYQPKQVIGMVIGVVVMCIIAVLDYTFILKFQWLYYIGTIVMLVIVLIWGDDAGGAVRWIDIGIIRFQPSELGKVLLILFFAAYFSNNSEKINEKPFVIQTAILAAIPLALIIKEPDLSTTIVTASIICSLLFVAGFSYKVVCLVLGISIPSVFLVLYLIVSGSELLQGYQNNRILAWLKPDEYPSLAFQQQNSIMAIGSGQLWGKGLYNDGADSVKNGNYIPTPHTDFIFAVAGEELGFVGCVAIVLLILFIVFQCFRVAKISRDLAGQLICTGMAALIGFQSFINICVVTGLMPNTGLTLPFVSYGLTSLITLYAGIGFVLNVGIQGVKKRRGGYYVG